MSRELFDRSMPLLVEMAITGAGIWQLSQWAIKVVEWLEAWTIRRLGGESASKKEDAQE